MISVAVNARVAVLSRCCASAVAAASSLAPVRTGILFTIEIMLMRRNAIRPDADILRNMKDSKV